MKVTEVIGKIKPYVVGWISDAGGGAGPYAPTPHDLSSSHHSGDLADSQFPNALLRDGSRSLLDDLAVADGKTVDSVDISVLDSDFDTHAAATAQAGHSGGLGEHSHENAAQGGQLDHSAALTNINADDHHDPVTIGAGGLSAKLGLSTQELTLAAIDHADLSNIPTNDHIDHTSVTLTAGDGLTGGGDISANRTLAVGAGDGITVNANDVAVDVTDIIGSGLTESSNNIDLDWGTPTIGTIEPDDSASAGTSTNPARSDHQHAILTASALNIAPNDSAAEGNASSFARSDHVHGFACGAAATLSVNTSNTEGYAYSFSRSDHLHAITTSSNPGASASILASAADGSLMLTDLTLSGALSAASVGSHLTPQQVDTYDLGSASLLWRKGWLSELESVLFVENAVQVTGGWWMVPHGSGTLSADVASGDTTIDFGRAMTNGDFAFLRGNGQVEYLQVGSLVSGTTYNVTRNLDGSGANAWPQGHVYVIRGQSGDGNIQFDAQTGGPRISIFTQGATYNAETEVFRAGDLDGWGPYSSTVYGVAIGDYSGGDYLRYDPSNGMEIGGDGSGVTNIDGGNIQSNSVAATQIAANTITASEIASGTITATEIAAGTITATEIASNTITAANIAAGTVDTSELAAGAVTATQIAAGTITATEIASGAIDTDELAAGAVTATKISVSSLSAVAADMGTLTAGEIRLGSGTVGSNFTGIRIYESGSTYRVAGYNNDTLQAYLDSDGKLKAGGGNVVIDSDGVTFDDNTGNAYLRFAVSSTQVAGLSVSGSNLDIEATNNISVETDSGLAKLSGASVSIIGVSSILLSCSSRYVNVDSDLCAYSGLYVGGGSRDWLNDGDIYYEGDLRPVRGTTYTAYSFVPLVTPETSTSWDGDAKSSGTQKIDVSSAFGISNTADIKAYAVRFAVKDSATGNYAGLGGGNSGNARYAVTVWTHVNNIYTENSGIVPADSNGDIYFTAGAAVDGVFIQIFGYFV